MAILASLLAALAACRSNPRFCGDHPGNNCDNPIDASTDGRIACSTDQQCTAPAAVCDTAGSRTCVQCTASELAACTRTAPACIDNACQPCTAHAQCPSSACLPDGTCGDDASVAYVDPGGTDNDTCTRLAPCTGVDKALETHRPFVKLRGTINEQVTVTDQDVTLLADPGAKLTDTMNGILLKIEGASHVAIYDLEISGASGMNSPGLSLQPGNTATVSLTRVKVSGNQGGGVTASGGTLTIAQSTITGSQGTGVSASNGATLTVTHSTISGNTGTGISASNGAMLTVTRSTISGNTGAGTGGGIAITGSQYQLSNNFIIDNGSPLSAFGAVLISQITTSGTHVFEFNTVSGNQATAALPPGVVCSTIATPLAFSNSIVFDNGTTTQVEGSNCSWSYSDIGPTAAPGTGNLDADPRFADVTHVDFHLLPGSPAKDAADPAAALAGDYDGDPRPQGTRRDMGADEVKP